MKTISYKVDQKVDLRVNKSTGVETTELTKACIRLVNRSTRS